MKYSINIKYSTFFLKQHFFRLSWNMEYSKIFPKQDIFQIFGIWNVPKKNNNRKNVETYGIWNIPGIFLKNCKTIKITKILEYGIFHGIFLEYSKKYTTSYGGVKFNQETK